MAVIKAEHSGFIEAYGLWWLPGYISSYPTIHDLLVPEAFATIEAYNDCVLYFGGQYDHFPPWWMIGRGGLVFDLAGEAGIIISITLSLKVQGSFNSVGFNLVAVTGDDLDDALVIADYGELLLRTTPFGSVAIPSGWYPEAGYNIALNADGIAYIQSKLGGKLRLGMRTDRDIGAIPFAADPWWYEEVNCYGVDAAEDDKPKLIINYAVLPVVQTLPATGVG